MFRKFFRNVTHILTRPRATVAYLVGALTSIITLASTVKQAITPLQAIPSLSPHLMPIIAASTTAAIVCSSAAAIGHSVMTLWPVTDTPATPIVTPPTS